MNPIDTLLSDMYECAGVGYRAFKTRRQLRHDAQKYIGDATAEKASPIHKPLRWIFMIVIIVSILKMCGIF